MGFKLTCDVEGCSEEIRTSEHINDVPDGWHRVEIAFSDIEARSFMERLRKSPKGKYLLGSGRMPPRLRGPARRVVACPKHDMPKFRAPDPDDIDAESYGVLMP